MRSNDGYEVVEAFDALDAAVQRCAALSFDRLTTPERLVVLARSETVRRRLPTLEHELINQLVEQSVPAELGGRPPQVLADRLRITRGEATRRIKEAADLGPRIAITGEPLAPALAATAAAQRAGRIGGEQVRVIRSFLRDLPGWVDGPTRQQAENTLAELAAKFRPEQVRKAADRISALINPDGTFSDAERARRRGLTVGPQGCDGMSPIRGWLTPEARAGLDAVLSKWAAPGMCNPDDESPTVDEEPTEDAISHDPRSSAQRNHDALSAALRSVLASGELGRHHGLPVTIVVSTTLKDLESRCGQAVTGAGTLVPMSDVIRMAGRAYHYLVIFDDLGRPLHLGRRRIASADQRIVLHAKDRGCSAPGCDVPGFLCQVHHVDEWADGGNTDIDNLTFACAPHHRLVGPGGWTTRKLRDGTTEWIPPPHLDTGQPRTNNYHHPDRYLSQTDED
jgi:hypothetical protein